MADGLDKVHASGSTCASSVSGPRTNVGCMRSWPTSMTSSSTVFTCVTWVYLSLFVY